MQESGTRPARPVPYELHVHGTANFADGTFEIHFGNAGKTAVYQVRSGNSALGPWNYTVGQGASLSDTWQITANSLSTYDLSVNGPNGFLRAFQGSVSGEDKANVHVHTSYKPQGNGITLHLANHGASAVDVRITDIYTGSVHTVHLKAGRDGNQVLRTSSDVWLVRLCRRSRIRLDVCLPVGGPCRNWGRESYRSGNCC